jgi:hypothetical protein
MFGNNAGVNNAPAPGGGLFTNPSGGAGGLFGSNVGGQS